ncbi:hypothetical protein KCP71_06655 [Salmonella enterica subsp. enterica]|nr:hypothetical protein KCP71_06655 [Salmonella enterica subsp. enterica]
MAVNRITSSRHTLAMPSPATGSEFRADGSVFRDCENLARENRCRRESLKNGAGRLCWGHHLIIRAMSEKTLDNLVPIALSAPRWSRRLPRRI